jgi:hypothetical protein
MTSPPVAMPYARLRVVFLRASGAPADEGVGGQAEARLLEMAVLALRITRPLAPPYSRHTVLLKVEYCNDVPTRGRSASRLAKGRCGHAPLLLQAAHFQCDSESR